MAFVECGSGHVYDTNQYQACPYCNGGGNRIVFGNGGANPGIGKTVGVMGVQPGYEGVGSTVAPTNYQNQVAGNVSGNQNQFGVNAAPRSNAVNDTGKTVGVFQKSMKIEPVVGWLVCIEGPDKGKDFRILAKNNSVGRSDTNDICIKGDTTISRENQARIAYDEKNNAFHLIPGESANNIYIGEEPVYVPTVLEENTVIEMGETKLMFVPFCGERHIWKKEEK